MLTVLNGDCRELLKTLPDESVHCCVTSPPYFALRNYNAEGQIGLENSIEEHVAVMVGVFREVRRVLRSDATLWLNYGDGYKDKQLIGMPWRIAFALQADGWWLRSEIIYSKPNPMPESVTDRPTKAHEQVFLLAKSARYFYDAEAIREAAEYGRRPMPSNTWDRCKVIPERIQGRTGGPEDDPSAGRNRRTVWTIATQPYSEAHFATFPAKLVEPCILAGTSARGCCAACGAPWERVVERGELIHGDGHTRPNNRAKIDEHDYSAYSRPNGLGKTNTPGAAFENKTIGWQPTCCCAVDEVVPAVVLDPFAGSGTVGQVALEAGRRAVLIELNPAYCAMIEKRNTVTYGLPGLA